MAMGVNVMKTQQNMVLLLSLALAATTIHPAVVQARFGRSRNACGKDNGTYDSHKAALITGSNAVLPTTAAHLAPLHRCTTNSSTELQHALQINRFAALLRFVALLHSLASGVSVRR
jgi:hypothetical protein